MNKLILSSLLLSISMLNCHADFLIFDDFDNANLATGGINAINGGFYEVDNGTQNPGSASESGSIVSLNDGQNQNIYGILSNEAVDFGAFNSVTTRWTVTQYSIKNKSSYMAFTWQTNSAYTSTPELQVTINLETQELVLESGDGVDLGKVDIDPAFGLTDSSFELTAVFTESDFTIRGSGGLKDVTLEPVNLTRTWAEVGKSHPNVVDGGLQIGTLLNANGNGGLLADVGLVTVEAIPEPAVIAFIGIFGGGLLVARRWFGQV